MVLFIVGGCALWSMETKAAPPGGEPDFPPLEPEAGLGSIRVPAGFRVELAAAEPETADPVAIDWDLAGRLWVVEMVDYPSGMDDDGKPGGRVRVLEDRDGDGRYESSRVFADGLAFPNGLLTWRGGVIVTAAPDILFLKDTDGDGRADVREVLLSGLSEGNQQLRANGLRWGLDGRVYCAAGGHHGGHAADTVLRGFGGETAIGSRDFSFDPDAGKVRAESGPSQFGRNRDDDGAWFGTQNSRALWHYVLEDRYLVRNPHVPAPDPVNLLVRPVNAPVFPISPAEKRFHSFENAGHFTSACSGMIYRDDLLFPRREGERDAFTCEPFHNLVQHNVLTESGVTFTARRAGGEPDFFASSDRWCRPVMCRTGPDGALWVVDMYRYIIEHPAWLPDDSREELMPFYRLGDDRGRIYRVVPSGQVRRKVVPMDGFSAEQLVAALASPNEWVRDKAQMALHWMRRPQGEDPDNSGKVAAAVDDAVRVALNSPHALARLTAVSMLPAAKDMLALRKDAAPGVRQMMLRKLEELPTHEAVLEVLDLAVDQHPFVRLQFAFSAGSWMRLPESMTVREKEVFHERIGSALARVAAADAGNHYVRAAVMSSALPHFRPLARALGSAGGEVLGAYAADLIAVALAVEDREALALLLQPTVMPEAAGFSAVQMDGLARLLLAFEGKGLSRAGLSGRKDLLSEVLGEADRVFAFASGELRRGSAPLERRAAAAALLVRESGTRAAALEVLKEWLRAGNDETLRLAAVRAMVSSGDAMVPALLLRELSSSSPQTGRAMVDALLSRESWALALMDHVQAHPATPLDSVQKARLMQSESETVRARAVALLKPETSRRAAIEALRPALGLKGSSVQGRALFATRCIACHEADGIGHAIGPDLKSVVSHPAEKLLTSIVDPSLDVQPGYFAFNAGLKDGSELYGIITSETGNSLTFRLPDGSERLVGRSEVRKLESTGQSLMPAGLENGWSPQDIADVIAWLQSRRSSD